jgi:peptidoglycan/xylan/chitin deacetylase (PgdA/CDA1 family)
MSSLVRTARRLAISASGRPASQRVAAKGVQLASAADRSAPRTLAMLTYHRVGPRSAQDPLAPTMVSATPEGFREQLEIIREHFNPVSLAQVRGAVERGGQLPERAVHVTFDDAYADFAEYAWPVLRSLEVPATMFVATGYPGGELSGFWWDRLWHAISADAPEVDKVLQDLGLDPSGAHDQLAARRLATFKQARDRLRGLAVADATAALSRLDEAAGPGGAPAVLSWSQLQTLHQEGLAVGSHTHSHPLLTMLSTEDARAEIRRSIEDLDRRGFADGSVFAYPGGDHDDRIRTTAAAAGCTMAVTTVRGVNVLGRADPLRLRRINVGAATNAAVLAAELVPSLARSRRWADR